MVDTLRDLFADQFVDGIYKSLDVGGVTRILLLPAFYRLNAHLCWTGFALVRKYFDRTTRKKL